MERNLSFLPRFSSPSPRPFLSKPSFILCCSNAPAHSESPGSSNRMFTHSNFVRRWFAADTDTSSRNQDKFMVVSWNILADRNAFKHRDLYQNVPLTYLKWNYRKRIICNELIEWNPDIICLQEVDRYYDLLNIMEKVGYVGSYKRRTGDTVDGCATFWKSDKFQLLEGESIEYNRFGLRDNVAQICVFEMRNAAARRILVGNIHVLYNPSRGDVKLGQILFLASRADILSNKWGNAPIVLAGDYNSTPQSAIYKFLSTSKLNIMSYDRRELSGQRNCHPAQALGLKREKASLFVLMDRFIKSSWTEEEIKIATGGTSSPIIVHPLKLSSSYAMVKSFTTSRGPTGEPLATSHHSKFLGTVDYLWYSDGLVPSKVLDTLSIDSLRKIGGLPSKDIGSDHLALVSEFSFVGNAGKERNTARDNANSAR